MKRKGVVFLRALITALIAAPVSVGLMLAPLSIRSWQDVEVGGWLYFGILVAIYSSPFALVGAVLLVLLEGMIHRASRAWDAGALIGAGLALLVTVATFADGGGTNAAAALVLFLPMTMTGAVAGRVGCFGCFGCGRTARRVP